MTNEPPITVLMSVYNGSHWLNESISSVINQTFRDFEFLIINDGSTDNSLEIIEHFSNNDARIKIINKKNTGLADSLNQGIHLARGEWIARIDADDISEPDRLEKQYRLAQSDSSLVLIGSGLQQINKTGKVGKVYLYPQSHSPLLSRLRSTGAFFAHSSAFYRTDMVRALGGYRLRLRRAQDLDLWLRLSEIGQLACINQTLVRIRHHDHQISHDEGGRRQRIDFYVAMVSYWLRHDGCIDPVDPQEPENTFEVFRDWIVKYSEKNKLFDYYLYIENIKKRSLKSQNKMSKALLIAITSTNNLPFLFRYIKQRLIGDRSTIKAARAWKKLNPCSAVATKNPIKIDI